MEILAAILEVPAQWLIGAIAALDSLPEPIRAILAALVLAGLLRYFEVRIPAHEVQYGQSYRKAACISLLLIPALVYFFPTSRMVVFVEELRPPSPTDHWLWQILLLAWFSGFVISLAQLVRVHLSARREVAALIRIEDEKLEARLAHWQHRLGMSREIVLVQLSGDQPRQFMASSKIGIPTAALHWPGAIRDVMLIQALCHMQKKHGRWHLIAQLVACIYWPITWVQSLHTHLLEDLERSTDALADSCYQDPLGYARALTQLEQRLSNPERTTSDSDRPRRLEALSRYLQRIQHLITPAAEPDWNLQTLLAERGERNKSLWRDPYDKVVLFIGQAIFIAFLLTGMTLKERPPDFERNYALPFEVLWKDTFHRNLELQEKTTR